MAYHYYYHSDADRNPYQLPYHDQYSYVPPQALVRQSYGYGNDFDRCEVSSCYDYGDSYGYGYGCYGYGDRSDGYPIVAYSVAAGCSEPKQVEWGDGGLREVVAVEDEEVGGCGGGYDPVAAYGKQLTVSDTICYSRSEESEARVVAVVDPVTAQAPAAASSGKTVVDPVMAQAPAAASNGKAVASVEEFDDGSESDGYGDGSESDGSFDSDFSEDDDDFSEDDGLSENSFHHDGVVAAAAGNVGGNGLGKEHGVGGGGGGELGKERGGGVGAGDGLGKERDGGGGGGDELGKERGGGGGGDQLGKERGGGGGGDDLGKEHGGGGGGGGGDELGKVSGGRGGGDGLGKESGGGGGGDGLGKENGGGGGGRGGGGSGDGLGKGYNDGGEYGYSEHDKVVVSDDAPNGYEENSESPGFCDGLYGYLPCLNKKGNKTVSSTSDDAPNGYEGNSESPGFCDGIYGYLPCLKKKSNKTVKSSDGWVEKADENQWKAAADFIFGSSNPYAGGIPAYSTFL